MPTSLKSTPCGPRVLDAASLGDHLDRLLRAALALTGSRPDAEDLVQEVCLRVLAKPRVVRGSEIAYLHGVLRNTFFSDYQQRARRRTVPVEPETLSLRDRGLALRSGDRDARPRGPPRDRRAARATTATRSSRSTSSGSPTPRPPTPSACRRGRS